MIINSDNVDDDLGGVDSWETVIVHLICSTCTVLIYILTTL